MADPEADGGRFGRFARMGRGAMSAASASMEASGAGAVLSQAGAAASSAAGAALGAADELLPDEVSSALGEVGGAMKSRVVSIKDMFLSDDFKNFLKNPSPEQLLLHPEYLFQSLKVANAVRSPSSAGLGLLTGGVMDVSKKHVAKAAAGQAGAQVSEATGGLVPASVVGNMSPSEMQQAMKLMSKLGPLV